MWPSSPKFEGQTLVLPAVSYGNVGQLAVDVLLCTALSTSDATHARDTFNHGTSFPFVAGTHLV